jgi:hypothetical protein
MHRDRGPLEGNNTAGEKGWAMDVLGKDKAPALSRAHPRPLVACLSIAVIVIGTHSGSDGPGEPARTRLD